MYPNLETRELALRDTAFGRVRSITWADTHGGSIEVGVTRTLERHWRSLNLVPPELHTLHAVTAAVVRGEDHPYAVITRDDTLPGITVVTIASQLRLLFRHDEHSESLTLLTIERTGLASWGEHTHANTA